MALVALALLAVVPAAASAAPSETQPAEETLSMILVNPKPGTRPDLFVGTHALTLSLLPLRGIAVVYAASNNYEIENKESAIYAERISKGPFDGHLDLHFKGLGRIVGDFVPGETNRGRVSKGCVGPASTSELGRLHGSIEFHGGGFRRWSASSAVAFVERSPRLRCRHGAAEHKRRPKKLIEYTLPGFGSFSGWRYGLRARLKRPHRQTGLSVYLYGAKGGPRVNFDATTYEYLPGGIAASRSVFRSASGAAQLEASEGGYHPEEATLRPPNPFSGVGTYSHATRRLTGSLAVQFPGLRLRLGSADTVADLIDEAGLPEKTTSSRWSW
jgi:hypothetical protein